MYKRQGVAGEPGEDGVGSSVASQIPFTGSGFTNGYLTRPGVGNTTTGAFVANRLFHQPFILTKTITITTAVVTVTTAVASSRIYLGIRRLDQSSAQPTTEIIDCGSVASDSVGTKQFSFASTVLTPGIYYFDLWSQHAPSISAIPNPENLIGVQFAGSGATGVIMGLFRNGVTGIDSAGMPADVSGDTYTIALQGSGPAFLVGIK